MQAKNYFVHTYNLANFWKILVLKVLIKNRYLFTTYFIVK